MSTITFTNVKTGAQVGRWLLDDGTILATPGAAKSVLDATLRHSSVDEAWERYSSWSNGYYVSALDDEETKGLARFIWNETLHPRGPAGRFAKKPTSARRPYEARRTRVGGRLGGRVGGHDYEAEFPALRSRWVLPDDPDMPEVPDVSEAVIPPMPQRGEIPLGVLSDLIAEGEVINPHQGQEANVSIHLGPLGGVVRKVFHKDNLPWILVQNGVEDANRSPRSWARESVRSEVEGAKVAEVFGVKAARVEKVSDYSIVADLMPWDSTAPSDQVEPGKRTDTQTLQKRLARLIKDPDEGGRMALFDFVTHNMDRHDGNTLISDGHLASIDHSNLLRTADSKNKNETIGDLKPWLYAIQNQWIINNPGTRHPISHRWSTAELEGYKTEIKKLDISRTSRRVMLHRLDLLIEIAEPPPPSAAERRRSAQADDIVANLLNGFLDE